MTCLTGPAQPGLGQPGLPSMACLMLQGMGRMFLQISSMGPGRLVILSFRSSARRALLCCSCLACADGSADASAKAKLKVRPRDWTRMIKNK